MGEVIKLGIDVHIEKYVVVMKIDGSAPERAKRFTPEQFIVWVHELAGRCDQLYSCYEAGPFGFNLHRRLQEMGVTNHVIRPINWDEHGKNVKTDARDATQMVLCLDGYLRGNHRSFSTVRVPSETEERRRSIPRQRQSLIKERKRLAAKARGHVMYYGGRLQGGMVETKTLEGSGRTARDPRAGAAGASQDNPVGDRRTDRARGKATGGNVRCGAAQGHGHSHLRTNGTRNL
ncbi:MAG: transposase [Candidatus Synoicihabitans palmerolidicus]|nr:transposase [Candidatus Synoicihabitans palmerolidicus]